MDTGGEKQMSNEDQKGSKNNPTLNNRPRKSNNNFWNSVLAGLENSEFESSWSS